MAPRIKLPDAEAALIGVLRTGMPGVHAGDTLRPPWPALRVTQVGGAVATVLETASVQLDVAGAPGSSKAACRALMDEAISRARAAAGSTVAGVVLHHVRVLGAPAYLPDGLTGAPRYTATLTVTARSSTPGA